MTSAAKTYVIRFTTAMVAYSILLIIVIMIIQQMPQENLLRYVLVILPVIPISFGLLAFVRFFDSMDELQKTIQLSALAFSFAATALISFTYGMLETAGLPHLPLVWIFPLMVGLWGIGVGIASRRYQ